MTTNIIATAFCLCKACCSDADGLTASGTMPREGVTIAASRAIPLGTRVALTIPGAFTNRVFIVEDRLARRFDNRVDVFISSHRRAKVFGKQNGRLTIIK